MDFAGQHLEEGRLAGAVRPDDAAQFAALDREVDIVVGDHAAVALAQARRLQDHVGLRHRGAQRRGRCGRADLRIVVIDSISGSTASWAWPPRRIQPVRSTSPPTMPRRRNTTSSTNTRPSTSFQVAPRCSVHLEEVAQIEPDGSADQRPEQRAGAADRGLHDELAGGFEGEGVRRHEALHHAEQAAGETGIGGGDDEGGQLVTVDVVADRLRPQRIFADRAQHTRPPASARYAARARCRRNTRTPGTYRATSRY